MLRSKLDKFRLTALLGMLMALFFFIPAVALAAQPSAHESAWVIYSPDRDALVGGSATTSNSDTISANSSWTTSTAEAQWGGVVWNNTYSATHPYYIRRAATSYRMTLGNSSTSSTSLFWGIWSNNANSVPSALRIIPQGDGSVKLNSGFSNAWGGFNSSGDGQAVAEASAAKLIIIPPTSYTPGAPINGSVTKTGSNVTLSWSPPAPTQGSAYFFAGFRVYRETPYGSGTYNELTSLGNLAVTADQFGLYSFTDNTAAGNARYRVITYTATNSSTSDVNTNGAGYLQIEVGLDTPKNAAITGDSDGATISWDAVPNATGYKIYRGTGRYALESFTTLVATVTNATSYYTKDYVWDWYKVVATDDIGVYLDGPSDVLSLEITTFKNTEIYSTDDPQSTVIKHTDYWSNLFYWGNSKPTNTHGGLRGSNQFTDDRVALLFRPVKTGSADYTYLSLYLNFYMHIAGLGKLPTDVRVNNVRVYSWESGSYNTGGNVTQNFWRTWENMYTTSTSSTDYGVSQASPVRRVRTSGSVNLQPSGGNASGGYWSDSIVTTLSFGGQQQFYVRNTAATTSLTGLIWNGLFQGITQGETNTAWRRASASTVVYDVQQTPYIAEKPFLYFDVDANNGTGDYKVFVPDYQANTAGQSWGSGKANDGMGVGKGIKLSEFFVADETMTADEINAGMKTKNGNVFFTPGTYNLDKEIHVTEPYSVLLGIGMASLRPTAGNVCVKVADVPGVRVAGLMLDAGPAPGDIFTNASEALIVVGEKGCSSTPEMEKSPIVVSDVFVRVGGCSFKQPELAGRPAKAKSGFIVNADFAIVDHTWIWRADHGESGTVGWTLNETNYGLVVNGDHVITYGLHSEHYQIYDVLWNGDDGRCYFLQNERPYDTPTTNDEAGAWRDTSLADPKYDYLGSSADRQQGFASFRVADDVKNFEGWALVTYDVFTQNRTVGPRFIWTGIITPVENANIKVHQVGSTSISGNITTYGRFLSIINGLGNAATLYSKNYFGSINGSPATHYWSNSMPDAPADTLRVERADLCLNGYTDSSAQCSAHSGESLYALGKPYICMTILNTKTTEQTPEIIVAGYDSNNRLVALTNTLLPVKPTVSYSNGGVGGEYAVNADASYFSLRDYAITLDLPKSDSISYYKAFIWSVPNFVPLTNSFSFPAN